MNPFSIRLATVCIFLLGISLPAIADPEPTKVYEAWRQDERVPNFKVREGYDEADLGLLDYNPVDEEAWAVLESALNEAASRLATGGFLSGKKFEWRAYSNPTHFAISGRAIFCDNSQLRLYHPAR